MSIGKRIQEAIFHLNEDDLEGVFLPLFTAVDATSKKEFSNMKENRTRNEAWPRKSQGFIT